MLSVPGQSNFTYRPMGLCRAQALGWNGNEAPAVKGLYAFRDEDPCGFQAGHRCRSSCEPPVLPGQTPARRIDTTAFPDGRSARGAGGHISLPVRTSRPARGASMSSTNLLQEAPRSAVPDSGAAAARAGRAPLAAEVNPLRGGGGSRRECQASRARAPERGTSLHRGR